MNITDLGLDVLDVVQDALLVVQPQKEQKLNGTPQKNTNSMSGPFLRKSLGFRQSTVCSSRQRPLAVGLKNKASTK